MENIWEHTQNVSPKKKAKLKEREEKEWEEENKIDTKIDKNICAIEMHVYW